MGLGELVTKFGKRYWELLRGGNNVKIRSGIGRALQNTKVVGPLGILKSNPELSKSLATQGGTAVGGYGLFKLMFGGNDKKDDKEPDLNKLPPHPYIPPPHIPRRRPPAEITFDPLWNISPVKVASDLKVSSYAPLFLSRISQN